MHYGDMIRILGTIVVVVGHVSDMVLYSDGTKPLGAQWWVANLWDAAARWAVPIYIMLSGSLLLDPHRTESPSKFYHKRLMRIGAPLVFWSLFFMWVDVYYTGWHANHDAQFSSYEAYGDTGWVILWPAHTLSEWSHYLFALDPAPVDGHTRWEWFKYLVFCRPKIAWLNLLKGEPYVHMHFIFRIAGLYAFTPLIRICLKHVSRAMLMGSVITMLVLSSADSIANNITGTELSAFGRFVPFLGYYLAGYMLRETHVSKLTLAMCWLGMIACIGVLAGGTGLIFHHYIETDHITKIFGPPSIVMILYDFLSPVRVVMALCSWIVLVNLFKDPWPHGERGRSIIRFWANTTLGLYLIHPFFREMWFMQAPLWLHTYIQHVLAWPSYPVLRQLQYLLESWMKNGINATWPSMWWGVPVSAALVYVPSLISAIVIMRIPFVRRIAG
jgi:surface polysaccharide O-acyltransferase-like enzyme